jgi:hypothetical protein
MERETGIEPVDIQLAKLAFYPCPLPYLPDTTPVPRNAGSGAALHVLRFSRMQRPDCLRPDCSYTQFWTVWTVWFRAENICWKSGAGDGTRTRDLLLGKQILYQLSYSRHELPARR